MIRKVLMAVTVVVLVLLIIITPRLMGTEKEVSSQPMLVVDYYNNNTTIYVTSPVDQFRYSNISIFAEDSGIGWYNFTREDDINSLFLRIHASITTNFFLNVSASDGETLYEYNCSVVINVVEEKIEIYGERTYNVYPTFKILMRAVSD